MNAAIKAIKAAERKAEFWAGVVHVTLLALAMWFAPWWLFLLMTANAAYSLARDTDDEE